MKSRERPSWVFCTGFHSHASTLLVLEVTCPRGEKPAYIWRRPVVYSVSLWLLLF